MTLMNAVIILKNSVASLFGQELLWKHTSLQIKWSDVNLTLCYGAGRNHSDHLVHSSHNHGDSPLLPMDMLLVSASSHEASMWLQSSPEQGVPGSKYWAILIIRANLFTLPHLVWPSHLVHDSTRLSYVPGHNLIYREFLVGRLESTHTFQSLYSTCGMQKPVLESFSV